jgi:hypothetical protein
MIYKKTFRWLILFLLIAVWAAPGFAQDDKLGTFVIKTETGYLLVHNRDKNSYSLEFKGTRIEPMKSDHPKFLLDGKFVQVVNATNEQFWKPKADSKVQTTPEEYLEAHRVWESDYLGNAMNAKLSVASEFLEIGQKKKALLWSFPMPQEFESPYTHQLFLSTLLGNDVLLLNVSVGGSENQKSIRNYIIETMNTLKTNDKPFNIKELTNFLKKGESAE